MLEMEPIEQNIIKQAERFGQPIPDRIKNKPEIQTGLEFHLDAFFDLDSERSHAIALTAIPRSKIVDYAKEYELDEDQKERLLFYIRRMDNEHIKRLKAKQPTK